MRVDFGIGAFQFMYVGADGNEGIALNLFMKMTNQIGKVLPNEIIQALVAADPKVIEAMRQSTIREFAQKFDDQVIEPIVKGIKDESS